MGDQWKTANYKQSQWGAEVIVCLSEDLRLVARARAAKRFLAGDVKAGKQLKLFMPGAPIQIPQGGARGSDAAAALRTRRPRVEVHLQQRASATDLERKDAGQKSEGVGGRGPHRASRHARLPRRREPVPRGARSPKCGWT